MRSKGKRHASRPDGQLSSSTSSPPKALHSSSPTWQQVAQAGQQRDGRASVADGVSGVDAQSCRVDQRGACQQGTGAGGRLLAQALSTEGEGRDNGSVNELASFCAHCNT